MNNTTRKIVVLKSLNSPQIEQAIFILRDEVESHECDVVTEAQRIVNMYINSLENPPSEKKKKPRAGFFIGMALYTFMTVAATFCFLTMT